MPPVYLLNASETSVEFWSEIRMPLEPKGDMRDGLDQLRSAVRQLTRPRSTQLAAELWTNQDGFFDVENVLVYNVGTGVFSECSSLGLRVSRVDRSSPAAPSGHRYPYYHLYSFEPVAEPPSSSPLLTFPAGKLTSSTKPHEVWWSIGSGEASTRRSIHGPFELVVFASSSSKNLSAVVKPLLDGIISSMHTASGIDEESVTRLAAKCHWDRGDVKKLLLNPLAPVLSPRRVLTRFRDFVKWDPADDLCFRFTVVPTDDRLVRVWAEPIKRESSS